MIEGIFQIGKIAKDGKSISQIATDIPNRKENITYKIGKINFDLKRKIIEIDLNEEYEPGKEEKYKFIQLKLTGRQNQFFATFTDLKRFLGKTGSKYASWLSIEDELCYLYKNNPEKIKKFFIKIQRIKHNFYDDYTLDPSKVENLDGLDFKKFIKNQLGKNEDIIFWTIFIDNQKVVDEEFYDKLVRKKIIEVKKKRGDVVCSVCDRRTKEYFDDLARLPLKFYINDKIGFSQKLSDRWEGNFVLCEDCYLSLFAGEKFIWNNFNQKIGVISFLIIPEFIGKIPFTQKKIQEWSELTGKLYNPFAIFEEDELKKLLEQYREYGYLDYFLLNYIFFEQNNQQFKIFTVVKDLPRGRLDEIREDFLSYRKRVYQLLPTFSFYSLRSLQDIYWLIPLRLSKNDIIDTPKITNLFATLLEGRKIDIGFLIHEFWIGLKAKYFKNKSYHNVLDMEDTENQMNDYILKTHQLIFLLQQLNLVNGGVKMEIKEIPNEFQQYMKEANFDEKQAALFLLGTLIGDIGSHQTKYGSKPILNKINFQGMPLERVQILFNEIYEKLMQERLLYPDREVIYQRAKELFDKNLKNWNLKPYENVYYILSGYAFKTKLNIENAKEKKEENSDG